MSYAARRLVSLIALACGGAVMLLALAVPAASAHVVPTSSVQLDVGTTAVTATVSIPVTDVEAATGLDLGDGSQAAVDAEADAIETYLQAHFTPTSDDGQAWTVSEGGLQVGTTGDPTTTGRYQQLVTTFTLTPPAGSSAEAAVRSFNLGYDAIVDHVATHVAIVTVSSDATDASFDGAYELGVVRRSTVTNTVEPLHVELGSGSEYRGLVAMVHLGMQHIAEGTDHQLFLLTLLLPAPLLAAPLATAALTGRTRRRRWAGPVPARRALHRIATITLSFTLGHSVTLALGTLGVPAPQALVEATIALSILVAAVHAVRPLFPGREAAVAAAFGLVHGLAFSETLRALDLSGTRLVLALLGFNLGIEAMQLLVVALVLPPLILLARTRAYPPLRVVAATATGVAAIGWVAARLGLANPVADAADRLGSLSVPVVVLLWLTALGSVAWRSARREPAGRGSAGREPTASALDPRPPACAQAPRSR